MSSSSYAYCGHHLFILDVTQHNEEVISILDMQSYPVYLWRNEFDLLVEYSALGE